ncbi:MAG: hypothetical protein JNN08_11145 [Bryobacterales bacterium]|nr:hypothetical protein [Bryobacterales bacterium]
MEYTSQAEHQSITLPGVRYKVARMSLGRRIELAKRLREIGLRGAFHAAGSGIEDQIEASIAHHEIDRIYLKWGLVGIEGLSIDGCEAGPDTLIESGPEPLVAEILAAIRKESNLSEEERKN